MAVILYCGKCQNKVGLRYGWGLIYFKMQKQGTAGVSFH